MLKVLNTTKSSSSTVSTINLAKLYLSQTTKMKAGSSKPFLEKENE